MQEFIQKKEEALKAIKKLEAMRVIGYDVESTGLDPLTDKVLLLQLGNELHQYVFDVARLIDDGSIRRPSAAAVID